jgi:SsrA-binding protein
MTDRLVASNKRARRDYELLETLEAGLVLTGTEVKSLREGRADLTGGYATVEGEEVWLHDVHIPPYGQGGYANHPPKRPRKLLLNRRQIRRLIGQVAQKGVTLVPLRLYFKEGWAKVEIALARGRPKGDKRQRLAEETARREMQQAIRRHRG